MPKFEDIAHYLDYIMLDEPIIGLNYVEEVSVADPQGGPRNEPRYSCLLCRQNAPRTEMIRHLIGRKHRQKYLETKRPDLVTWEKNSQATQSGKVIRARAEIVERQDGRGHPVLLPKKENTKVKTPNFSRDPPKPTYNWDPSYPQRSAENEPSYYVPRLMDIDIDTAAPKVCPSECRNALPAHVRDSYVPTSGMRDEDPLGYEGALRRADYLGSDVERRDYREPEFQRDYKEFGPSECESRAPSTSGQALPADSPYGRAYTDRGALEECYTQDGRGVQSRPAQYESPEQLYSEADNRRQSLNRDLAQEMSMSCSGRWGFGGADGDYRGFSSAAQGDRPYKMEVTSHDYGHKSRKMHQEDYNCEPGPHGRTGASVAQCLADIPEPFKRFLSGATGRSDQGKRKRKSRFSDASAEEVERAKSMFRDEMGPPKPKVADYGQPARPTAPCQTEGYQRGQSDSGAVFDLLSNIEIDNVEEADFLKSKLCDLLKEFKAKKMEKAGQQTSPGQVTLIREYNNSSVAVDVPPKPQYERQRLDDLDHRSPVTDIEIQGGCRERSWKQHHNVEQKPHQDFFLSTRDTFGHSSSIRGLYEEVIGRHDKTVSPRGYSESFQEPFQTRDYRRAGEELVDIRSPVPPPHMPQEKAIRYANNLEKITSTLLELVRRQ